MLDEKEKAPRAGSAFPEEMPKAGCLDNSKTKRSRGNTQVKFQGPADAEFDAEIALALAASMRAQELRECLIREISRTIAIGLQAQAALFDGDDEAALACLFRHWFLLRDDVRPLLLELRDVDKQGGAR
jgi:hypothetical protein